MLLVIAVVGTVVLAAVRGRPVDDPLVAAADLAAEAEALPATGTDAPTMPSRRRADGGSAPGRVIAVATSRRPGT